MKDKDNVSDRYRILKEEIESREEVQIWPQKEIRRMWFEFDYISVTFVTALIFRKIIK